MKRKIISVIAVVIAAFAFMAVSASACRQGPLWDGGLLEDVNAGEIRTGTTEFGITGNECKVYSFTPLFDGFYELTYSDCGCVFIGDNRFYDYLITCYSVDGTGYVTEIYNFKAGNTYLLYAADGDTYDKYVNGEVITETDHITLSYLGEMEDYWFSGNEIPEVYAWYADDDETPEYITNPVTVSFENGTTFYECELYGNCCGSQGIEVLSFAENSDGTDSFTLSLFGMEKDFTVTINPEIEDDRYENESPDYNAPVRETTLFSIITAGREKLIYSVTDFRAEAADRLSSLKVR